MRQYLFAEIQHVVFLWGRTFLGPVLVVEGTENSKRREQLLGEDGPVLSGLPLCMGGGVLMMDGSSWTGFLYSLKYPFSIFSSSSISCLIASLKSLSFLKQLSLIRLSLFFSSLIIKINQVANLIRFVHYIYYLMEQVQLEEVWETFPERRVFLLRQIMSRPPVIRSSPPKIPPPNVLFSEQDRLEQEKSIKNLPSLWILIAQEQSKNKISAFRQKMESIYRDSLRLRNKCIIYPNNLGYLKFIFQKQRPVNIFIYSNIITTDSDWDLVKKELQREGHAEYIDQIYVRLEGVIQGYNDQETIRNCNQRLQALRIPDLKFEIVKDFTEAEKKLNRYNFDIAKDKSSFLNLRKVGIDVKQTIGNFHHILLNTKSFLQESLEAKDKKEIQASFEKFKRFITEECRKQPPNNQKATIALKTIDRFEEVIQEALDSRGEIDKSKEEDFYRSILQAYAQQTPIYSSVSRLCKTITNKETFDNISFFCRFMYKAIHYFNKAKQDEFRQKNKKIQELVLYRGTVFGKPQLEEMKESIGDLVVNLTFNSSSYNQQIARGFLKKNSKSLNSLTSVLLVIRFHPQFYSKNRDPLYEQYIQFFADMNLSKVVSNQREEEILFNVFNIFKILSVKDGENEGRKIVIIELQYCGHIDLITKNFEEKTDDFEKNILDNIMRFNKSKDAFELLKEEGKKKEMLKVIYEKIDGDVELKPDETIAFTQSELSAGNSNIVEKMLEKIEIQQKERAKQMGNGEQEKLDLNKQMLKAICNSHLENNIQSVIELAFTDNPQEDIKVKNECKTIQQYFKIIQTKLLLASMQEKINSYDQCFSQISKVLELLNHEVQEAIAKKIIDTFIKYDQFLKKDVSQIGQSQRKSSSPFFEENAQQINVIITSKDPSKLKELLSDKKGKKQKGENEVLFLAQINQHIRNNVFARGLTLLRQLKLYKDLYFQKSSFLLKLIQFQFESRVKSSKTQEQNQTVEDQNKTNQSFKKYFSQYETSFKLLERAYQDEEEDSNNHRFEKALFFEHYSRFINAKLKIVSQQEEQIQNLTELREQKLKKAKQCLRKSNRNHNYLFNIDLLENTFLSEQVITQKKVQLSRIRSSILQRQSSQIRITQTAITRFKEKSKDIIKRYHESNSNLSSNIMTNTLISLVVDRIANPSEMQISKAGLQRQLTQYMNQFELNSRGKPFLQNHSSAALNNYLKALYFFYIGCSEAANSYLQESEKIIKQKMEKAEKQINENLKDEKKRKQMQIKYHHYQKTNDLTIKITLLKVRLHIHYKPTLYPNLMQNLEKQISITIKIMSRYHTTLLDLCSAYLGLVLISTKSEYFKKCEEKFIIAEKMAIFYKIDHSLEFFKLISSYIKILRFQEKKNEKQRYLQKFKRLAQENKLTSQTRGGEYQWEKDKLTSYMIYSQTMTYFDTENNPLYFKDIWTCFYKKKELGVPIHVKDLTLVRQAIRFYDEKDKRKDQKTLLKMTKWLMDAYEIMKINFEREPSKLGISFALKDKTQGYENVVLYQDYKKALQLTHQISNKYYKSQYSSIFKSPIVIRDQISKMRRQYGKLFTNSNK